LTQLVVEFGILRAKGFAAIPGKPMRLLVQGVGTRFDKHFDRAWRADEPRITRLVLIGQDLDAAQLEARLRQALGAC
ncbi:GTP-binding protein, partial [Pseudomonas syringae]|uniref:GTP-binding protein n=1 Tax=Pseudomonas syringae TaxID=317 RepID=UPI0034D796DF